MQIILTTQAGAAGVFNDEARYPPLIWVSNASTVAPQQFRQLGDIGGEGPGLVGVRARPVAYLRSQLFFFSTDN